MAENIAASCPHSAAFRLPSDGTPSRPSPALLALHRDEVTPLAYRDGEVGLIVTNHQLAKEVLADARFSQYPHRFPVSDLEYTAEDVDERAKAAAQVADLLALDGEQHSKVRGALTARLSLKSIRSLDAAIQSSISAFVENLEQLDGEFDLHKMYSEPISVAMHSLLLGIPAECIHEYGELYTEASTAQAKWEFVRRVLNLKARDLGDDVLSDLLQSDLTPLEIEGLAFVLFISGRDSVAYFISTSTVNILSQPAGVELFLAKINESNIVIEELMRFGSMFITLFPRTAKEDIEFGDLLITAGTSVSVSQVAANRDPSHFKDPEMLNLNNNSAGHLAFGHGIHSCVGQQFARIVLKSSLQQLFTKYPQLTLHSADQLSPMSFAHPVAVYEAGRVIVSRA